MDRMLEMVWMIQMCQRIGDQKSIAFWMSLTLVLCMSDSGTSGFKSRDSSAGEGDIVNVYAGPLFSKVRGVCWEGDKCVVLGSCNE